MPETGPDTFAGQLERWLAWLAIDCGRSPATVDKYGYYLRLLADYAAETGADPMRMDRRALEGFAGLWLHQRGLGARARAPAVAALRGFFGWLVREQVRADNPAAQIPYPTAGRSLPVPLELGSAERLINAPDLGTFIGVRDAALLALLIGCGVRVSELVALDEESLVWGEHRGLPRLVLRVTGKGRRTRLVPAPHEARLLVLAYLGHPELREYDRRLPNGQRVLFVSTANYYVTADQRHGEALRLSARSVQKMMARYGDAQGIPRAQLHPHAARHLYGTELAESETPLNNIQALLGHANTSTTEIYVHLAQRRLLQAVDAGNPLSKVRSPVRGLAGRV